MSKPQETTEATARLQQYQAYFADVEQEVEIRLQELSNETRMEGVRLLPQDCQGATAPKLKTLTKRGAVAKYEVRIGRFEVDVLVLHLKQQASKVAKHSIRTGTFGCVFKSKAGDAEWVVKRINFQLNVKYVQNLRMLPQSDTLEWAITEYAFCRVCSMLGIGPKMRVCDGFDITCFEDCLEFTMELCKPLSSLQCQAEESEMRLKYCVRLMHSLNLIHKDIKPSNIMYSPSSRDLVLIDFGISEVVKQQPGKRSLTYRQGTLKFMSEEMKGLKLTVKGYVDLYWNDVHALQKSMEGIRDNQVIRTVSVQWISTNSLPEAQSIIVRQQYEQYMSDQGNQIGKKESDRFSSIESFDLELLLRTFGDSQSLLTHLWNCQGPNHTGFEPKEVEARNIVKKHCQLVPTKAQIEELRSEKERQLALLRQLNGFPRPRQCIILLLLECADLTIQLGGPEKAANYLRQAEQLSIPEQWAYYTWLIAVLSGENPKQKKSTSLDVIVGSGLLQYRLGRYQQAHSMFLLALGEEQNGSLIADTKSLPAKKKVCVRLVLQILSNITPMNTVLWTVLVRFSFGELIALGSHQQVAIECEKLLMQMQTSLTGMQRATLLKFAGLAYYHNQQHQQAIEKFEKAIPELGSEDCFRAENLEIEALLIFSHQGVEDWNRAIDLYRQLLERMNPSDGLLVALINQRYAGCMLKAHQKYTVQARLLIESNQSALMNMPQSMKPLLHLFSSYLKSMQPMLGYADFQKQCGLIRFIEPHSSMFLAIGEEEEFEVVRLKADCAQMLAVACFKVRRKERACDLLRRLMKSLTIYLQKSFNDGDLFGLEGKQEKEADGLIEAQINKFLTSPPSLTTIFCLLLVCEPLAGSYLLLTALVLLVCSNQYVQLESLLVEKRLATQLSWIRRCTSTNLVNRQLVKSLLVSQLPLALLLCEDNPIVRSEDLYEKGLILYRLGDYQDCRVVLQKCREMVNKNRNQGRVDLAQLTRMLGDILSSADEPSATECYKQALELCKAERRWMGVAWCYLQTGRLLMAEKFFLKASNFSTLSWSLEDRELCLLLKKIGIHHLEKSNNRPAKTYLLAALRKSVSLKQTLPLRLQLIDVAYHLNNKRLFRRQAYKLLKEDTQATHRQQLRAFLQQKGEKKTLSYLFKELTQVCKVQVQPPLTSSCGTVWLKKALKYNCGLRGLIPHPTKH